MQKQKLIVYGAIAIAVIAIAVGLLITPTIWHRSELMTEEDIASEEEANFYEDYSDMLKVYSKLADEQTPVDDLQEEVKKLNEKATVELFDDNHGEVYVNGATEEYLTFDIIREEEDSPDMADNFVYHDEINGINYTIRLSGENTYQHFNGQLTSEFNSKKDAIMDHLLYR